MTAPIEDFGQARHWLRQEVAARDAANAANPALDRDVLEAELRRMWAADVPPEQVDIYAKTAYRAVEWPDHPRRRAVIAWVGLAIAAVSVAAAIFIAFALLLRSAYRPL